MARVKITQIRSQIGQSQRHRGTLRALGLGKIGRSVEHEETPGLAPTKAGVLEFFRMYRAAFPDLHMTIEQEIAEGDRVAVLWHGEALVRGKPLKLRGITIWRAKEGRLSEEWSEFDEATARAALTATGR